MRIYDLAKSIGQTFSVEVKSKELAEEFKTLPDFADIRDTIKSHSSSVSEEAAARMYQIYRERFGKGQPATGGKPAATGEAKPAPRQPRPVAPKATPSSKTNQPLPSPARPGGAPRPVPLRPNAPRPVAPLPAGRRPAPIAPSARKPEESGQGRSAPPAAPKKPAIQPQSPAQSDASTERPESSSGTQESSKSSKFKPSGLASELKSSSGTTGFSASPETLRAREGTGESPEEKARSGQPNAPAAPKFSSASPFVKPPPPPPETTERKRSEERPRGGGGEKRPSAKSGEREGEVITAVPEIGVMKMKPGGKRRSEKGKGKGEGAAPAEDKDAGKRKFRPSKVYGDADEFRRPLKAVGKKTRPAPERQRQEEPQPKIIGPVVITEPLTVAQFAEKIGVKPNDIIKDAFLKGKVITINQLIDFDLAEELAIDRDIDLVIRLEGDESDVEEFMQDTGRDEDMVPRAPVVTIMGHVDHGKTSILDFYRRSQVAEGEYGGITQHIGAYEVKTPKGTITFLDTPGHEAFTAMRARGAQCTDIIVLVVAADDGVMPQTIESINHARAAEVPLIVAINKVDLPQADPNKVRNELMQHNVLPSSVGGDVEFVEISAKQGKNLDALLELILLQAEVMELKGNPELLPQAVIIESHVDSLRGTVATVLIRQGRLHIGQSFVVGQQSGRIRAMLDDHGKPVEDTHLSQPVELIGLSGAPEVGELLIALEDERMTREIAERRAARRRKAELGTTRHVSLEGLHDMIAEGELKELNVILKADVQGSVEAIEQALDKLSAEAIRVRVLHSGTGSVNESDVNLAMASEAVILAFNTRPEPKATDLAARESVEIKTYRIIYELLEDIEKAMLGMLEKKYEEHVQGRSEVREVFRVSRVGMVAGCMVVSGEIHRNALCRLIRNGSVVYEGKVDSLRRHKDDASKVASGYECGIGLERFNDVKVGDIIETYTLEELPAELSRSAT